MKPWFLAGVLACGSAQAADWPQFLGPHRNGTAPESTLTETWPEAGPALLWSRKVGAGYAGPAVAGERVVIFHRVGDEDVTECLEARTGRPLWRHTRTTDYRDDLGKDEGPRAVPTVAEGRVYTHSAMGELACLDLATGRLLWSVDTRARYGSRKGFFGRACSPLVTNGLVMLNVGGPKDTGLMAFDADSGKERWRATDHEAGYASPVVAPFHGRPHALFLTREGLVVVDPATGERRFEHPWRSRMHASVNAATPLVAGDLVFLSASYGTGALVLRAKAPGAWEEVWKGDEILSNHYASSVQHDGVLYGFHGRQETGQQLRAVELETGRVRWSHEAISPGTLILAAPPAPDQHHQHDQGQSPRRALLVILTERGELILAPASPDGFHPLARGQVLGFGSRGQPALADGLFFARDKRQLVCLDLRGMGELGSRPTEPPKRPF